MSHVKHRKVKQQHSISKLLIYAHDEVQLPRSSWKSELMATESYSTGIRVLAHQPGSMPDMRSDGISVDTGKAATINLQQSAWNRLPSPYTSCTQHHYINDTDITYERDSCVKI